MNSRELLKELLEENKRVIDEVKTKYLHLSDEMLSKRPKPKKWSLNEIFEHLNLSNESYLNSIRNQLTKPNLPPYNPKFEPGRIGNFFTKFLRPKNGEVKNKLIAQAFLIPLLKAKTQRQSKNFLLPCWN